MPHKPIKYIKLYFIWRKNIQKFAYMQFLSYILPTTLKVPFEWYVRVLRDIHKNGCFSPSPEAFVFNVPTGHFMQA